jgi:hypothetical protein
MNYGYLLVSLAYVAFVVAVYLFESHRTRRKGVDTISLFLALFVLQCCAAGVVIYALWPYVDPNAATGVEAFDRILRATDVVTALLVLFLTVWFAIFFYVGCAFGRLILPRPVSEPRDHNVIVMVVKQKRLLVVLAGGLALTLYSFLQLGDNLMASYTNLILYRNEAAEIERNALNANAFALTQTWSWLTVVAIFCVLEWRGWRWLSSVCLAAAVAFALLGVSRRALFLPVLMIYLTLVLYSGRWRVRWIVVGAVPLVLLIAFGKHILGAVAYDVTVETIVESYESWMSALLRTATDIGITIVESLGTLQFLDIGLRLGTDHFLSILQRFRLRSLGFDFDFPERIVRISTAAFADAGAQDIPPGLLGQMWLDFGVVGPLIWGLAFGLQMSVIQFFFERTRRTRQAAAVFMLLVFVVALPLNTGSFDFTFSVDIIALVAVLLWCVRFRRQRLPQVRSVAKARAHLTLDRDTFDRQRFSSCK